VKGAGTSEVGITLSLIWHYCKKDIYFPNTCLSLTLKSPRIGHVPSAEEPHVPWADTSTGKQ